MKKSLLSLSLLFATLLVCGQAKKVDHIGAKKLGGASKSALFEAEFMGFRNSPSTDLKWRNILVNKKIGYKPESPYREEIEAIKATKLPLKMSSFTGKAGQTNNKSSTNPIVGTNFLGNTNNGSSPMDNSIAISNGGWIVSVANTTIEYDDMNGTNAYFNDIISFISDPTITNVCDPVVVYDPSADRFIFFAQECSGNSNNSYLLLFFSVSNNPNDGWYYYKLTGNPLNDGSSFDYPKLAISDNECYVAGNLFDSNSNFNQALLYQIDKNTGYNGGNLNWQYWYNLSGSPFTLCPVSYGQGQTYGPGIYVVATASAGGNTVKLYNLTNDINQNPSLEYYEIDMDAYSVAANCPQFGTTCVLDNGDCRTLSGFYLDGEIHFVFHSDVGNGWNGLNYNRLNLNSGTNTTNLFGDPGSFDYTYPSVVSFSNSPTDHSVMIGFGAVSQNSYAEIRAVNCDNNNNWSGSTLVKAGETFVSYTSSTEERWGDYTGTTRNHNSSSPSIWMNGMFGSGNNLWNTWIAEIHVGGGTNVDVDNQEFETLEDPKVYPNPAIETFNLAFTLNESEDLIITISDIHGRIVKELYNGNGNAGENIFSFNKANLNAGTYILSVQTPNKNITHEKIIIN